MAKPSVNWRQAFTEVGLILLGLLLAFSVDRMWERNQRQQAVESFVQRLSVDFDSSAVQIDSTIQKHRRISSASSDFLALAASGDDQALERAAPALLTAVFDGSMTSLVTGTLDEMKSTGQLDLLDEDIRQALAAFDAVRHGAFAMTERAELEQWVHRTQPFLNANVPSDFFLLDAQRDSLGVPDSPPDHRLFNLRDRELWNVVVHRSIYARTRLDVLEDLAALTDTVLVRLRSGR